MIKGENIMENQNIDWANIGFAYKELEYRYVRNYSNGAWQEGGLSQEGNFSMSECACVLQYAQTIFEGMKAYRTKEDKIVIFRPDQNAKRFAQSAEYMMMPVIPEDDFVKAVEETVRANAKWVPPYGSGASLYLRPFMFGNSAVIGIKPSLDYQFRCFGLPVGPYYVGGSEGLKLQISDFDRAAPHGTGHVKAGLNYAMSLHAVADAASKGYNENVYLDPQTRTKVEECGGANLLFVTKEGNLVTPKSETILPSITRRSLVELAETVLGLQVEHREVLVSELGEFVECGMCGTAAVVSPVGSIDDHGTVHTYTVGEGGRGPVIQKLFELLTGIQAGEIEGPAGWVHEVTL